MSESQADVPPHPKRLSVQKQNDEQEDDLQLLDEQAPVEREAGREIRKAWQELAKKATAKKQRESSEDEEDDEDGELYMEEDDYAAVLARMTREEKDKEEEDEHSDQEEEDMDDSRKQAVSAATDTIHHQNNHPTIVQGMNAAPSPPPTSATNGEPLRGDSIAFSSASTTFRSHGGSIKSMPNKTKKGHPKRKTHRRAESVENAMFGLLSSPPAKDLLNVNHKKVTNSNNRNHPSPKADRTKVQSSKTQPVYESPLLATNELIDTAQAQVEEEKALQKAQMRDSQLRNEEEQEQRLQAIINENGDKKVKPTLLAGAGGEVVLDRIEEDQSEEEEDDDDESDEEPATTDNDEENPRRRPQHHHRKLKRKQSRPTKLVRGFSTAAQQDWELFQQFLTPREGTIWLYLKVMGLLVVLPSLIIAACIFYIKEYPKEQDKGFIVIIPNEDRGANLSWWFLFIGCRQVVTLTLALATQSFVIDYLALGSRFSLKYLGPAVTLLAVQARGFPSVLMFWSLYNLILLSGDRRFAHHWLYWQQGIALFNEENYSGNVVNSHWNFRVLIIALVVGILVAIKRVTLGLFLARKTLSQFGDSFDKVKQNMLVVGELATLAMEIQIEQRAIIPFTAFAAGEESRHSVTSMNLQTIKKTINIAYSERSADNESQNTNTPNAAAAASAFVKKIQSSTTPNKHHSAPRSVVAVKEGSGVHTSEDLTFAETDDHLEAAEQAELYKLLGQWEGAEDRLERKQTKRITVGSILRFYKELTIMTRRYPFLPVFGRADTRERAIKSAQRLFERLMLRTPGSKKLPFSTIAILAKDDDGVIDKEKLKELISLFRPDRDGLLSKLDFVRSIDEIYRSMRQLSLNVEDSGQIDKAVTFLFNIFFYIIVGSLALQQLRVNPLQIFASLSSLILGFAFIFGGSSAKYFEGILFILVQKPYGVGDRIHLSHPASDTSPNGSSGWIVEKVTLTTTTLYWGATNERATLSNGAISNLRVINAARSPKATIYVHTKFGIDTHFNKIQVFRSAAEQFLKQRPREWSAFLAFRPGAVEIDRGYISYTLIAQHRESWQKIGAILGSKAKLTTFLLEVSKQLGMRYISPPLPVDLNIKDASDLSVKDASTALREVGIKDGVSRDQSGSSTRALFPSSSC